MVEGQEDVTWERWNRVVEATEQLGFDSVWRSDHLFSVVGATERQSLALWPSLTLVAQKTRRIRFGQLVSPLTFRNPVELAQHAVALDHLSGGRYVLGVGAGWYEREHRAFGFSLPAVADRLARLHEGLEMIQRLWQGEVVTYPGRYFTLEEAVLRPTPLQGKVPILIGGGGERKTLRLVAQFVDSWNPGFTDPESYRRKDYILHSYCQEVGRDPQVIERTLMVGYVIGRNRKELLRRAARIQDYILGTQPLYLLHPLTPEDLLVDLRRRWWFVGTPEEIVAQLQLWANLGIQLVMLQTFDLDDLDALEILAREVLPRVTN